MVQYIRGYYCPSDVELNLLEKESNRKILDFLREVYPYGKTAQEIAKIAGLPLKTTYPQLGELTRAGFITQLPKASGGTRGRPKAHANNEEGGDARATELMRQRFKYVLEDTKGIYDYSRWAKEKNKKNIQLPPGNVVYSDDFLELWNKIVAKEDIEELSKVLLRFLERMTRMIAESKDETVRKSAPLKRMESCCQLCGLNHEARDFIRAMLLHLIDEIEENRNFVEFLYGNQFLTQEKYQGITKKLEETNSQLVGITKQSCSHFAGITNVDEIISSTKVHACVECDKENIKWEGLRLCLTCGHVGCDDSSKGMHATKHFVETGHPVIIALPDNPWKWCYIHKIYG